MDRRPSLAPLAIAAALLAGCASNPPPVYVTVETPAPQPAPTPRTVYVTPPPPRKAPVGAAGDSPAGFEAVTRPQSYSE
jgi:hypothetical protein